MTEKLDNLSKDILKVLENAEPNRLRHHEIIDSLWKNYQYRYKDKKTFGVAVTEKLKVLKAAGSIIHEDIWYGTPKSKQNSITEKETEITIELPILDEEESEEEAELTALAEKLEKNPYASRTATDIKNYLKARKELRTIRIKGKNIDSETMDYIKEELPKLVMEALEKQKSKPFWKRKITVPKL